MNIELTKQEAAVAIELLAATPVVQLLRKLTEAHKKQLLLDELEKAGGAPTTPAGEPKP
jgi:hypothetical protein